MCHDFLFGSIDHIMSESENIAFFLSSVLDTGGATSMPLSVNAISLAYKLKSSEDQVHFLQQNGILPTSHTCSTCGVTCDKVTCRKGTNYFYFRCPGCKVETSIRYVIVLSVC